MTNFGGSSRRYDSRSIVHRDCVGNKGRDTCDESEGGCTVAQFPRTPPANCEADGEETFVTSILEKGGIPLSNFPRYEMHVATSIILLFRSIQRFLH